MRKLPARKMLGAIVAAALLLPSSGYTLGLGEIEVNSALNQRLKADIELLSATPEDAEDIIVKLASRKEFIRAGLDRPYLLNDLRFKSETINGVPYIRVSSASPIREPFLNFLVEIDWPNGHLLREYTVLLDPPVFMTQAASVSSNTASQASDDASFRPTAGGTSDSTTQAAPVSVAGVSLSSRPEATASAAAPAAETQVQSDGAATTWVPAPVISQQAIVNQPAGNYKINNGDTAWRLAQAMRPDKSVTVPQMMIAMLRTNPESFIDGNINGLKRGYILRVPDYDEIVSINQAEAAELVRQQAALWRQYRQSQAGGEPTSAMQQDEDAAVAEAEAGSSDTAAKADGAYLEIVSAGTGSSTLSGKDPTQMTAQELRAELSLARERVETELVEKEALQQRVDVLENNVNKMKGMLAIEDAELAQVESLGAEPVTEAVTDEPLAEATEAEVATETTDEALSEEATSVAEETEAQVDAEALAETLASTETEPTEGEAIDPEAVEIMADEALLAQETALAEGESAEEVSATEAAVFSDEVAQQTDAALTEMPDEMPTEVAEQLAPEMPVSDEIVSAEPQISQSGPAELLKKLQNNPMMLAAAGGGLLLFIVLLGSIIKRRKAAAASAGVVTNAFDELDDLTSEVAAESADESATADSQEMADDVDADATTTTDSSEDTIITEAAGSEEKAEDEPRDDVIAEADVYLAYGIYQQAEELLAQAIKDNPERDDYRVKLAETHYSSKNAEAFAEVATEIKGRVDNDSASWQKVMSMGQDLCADNPMFQGDMVGGLDVGAIGSTATAMDFDLGINNADGGEADLDSALDEAPLELPEMDEVAATQDKTEDEAEPENEAEDEGIAEAVDELEFDLSDAGAIEKPPVEEDEFSLDIDASELDIDDDDLKASDAEIDFGLDEVASAAEADEAEEEISLDLTDEVALMDMDLGEGAEAVNDVPEAEVAEVGIADAEEVPAAALTALSDDFNDEEDFDLSSLDDVDEISTKLDLARAYMDMGDHEGTKGILEEVIAEGDDEQKQEASELMQKLG